MPGSEELGIPALSWLLAVGLLCLGSAPAVADESSGTSPSPWSHTLGLYSQYISRGVTYTSGHPAVQASVQYSAPSGWYGGFWMSNVNDAFIHDATLETDPYGGYATIWRRVALDVGFWRWTFLNASLPQSRQKYDTIELYASATWRWCNFRYWHEVTDYFGLDQQSAASDYGLAANGGSRGSHYLEGNFTFDVGPGLSLGLHAGRQVVHHYHFLDFSDYRVGLDQDFGQGWAAGIAYSQTTADPHAYAQLDGLDTARGKLLVSLRRTF
jgi:uncharacterized protein (TIGR02001 family)